MSVKGGILSGIKSAADIVNEAAKRGMEPFATTIKRSRDKTYRPEQTIVRPSEEVEESLAKKLSRATDKDLTIDDKKATTIMPAPGKFFNQESKSFKPPIDKMAREALVEGDPDPIFGMYIDINAKKDATEKVYQNLFVSGRTAQKSTGVGFDKETQKLFAKPDSKAVSRALPYDGPELTLDQMKKNFESNTGEKGKEININLLQPERFNVIIDGNKNRLDHPIVAVHYPTRSKDGHYYTLDTQLVGPVYMKRNTTRDPRTNKAQSPNLKPATVGNIEKGLGKQIGVIRIAKPKTKKDPSGYTDHPLYDYIEVDGTAASSPDAPMSPKSKFNKGGAIPMQQQMEMFNEGGLKDEGGTKDPVSGNEVPSGSLQEEVRDDIDAKLSPGEFVFPADVTRFLGLRFLMKLRDEAKAGLQRMEDMGQMGNSEEAVLDNDVPFEPTDLIIMAGPPEGEMNKMNTGGMPVKLQTGGDMSDFANVPGTFGPVPGQGRFDQLVGQPQFEYEIKKFRNDAGAELFIPFVRGNPVYQPPLGYTEVTETQQQEELADPTLPQATIETELGSGELGGGPDAGDRSVGEMSPTEQANLGQFNIDNPMAAAVSEFTGNLAEAQMKTGFGAPVVSQVAGITGALMNRDDDATLADIATSVFGFGSTPGTKGTGTRNREKAEEMRAMRANDPVAFNAKVAEFSAQLSASIDKSLAGYSNATVAAAKSTALGASPAQMAAHAAGVASGDRPQGSTANAVGGYSTVSRSTPFGYSTNRDGEVDKRQTEIDRQALYGIRSDETDTPEGEAIGGQDTPGQEAQKSDPAETGMAEQEQDDFGGDPEIATGGFIPKRKKQKKMKRGGLASR